MHWLITVALSLWVYAPRGSHLVSLLGNKRRCNKARSQIKADTIAERNRDGDTTVAEKGRREMVLLNITQ